MKTLSKRSPQSVVTLEDTTILVAVVDELMRRTHKLVPQSADVIFVDATG